MTIEVWVRATASDGVVVYRQTSSSSSSNYWSLEVDDWTIRFKGKTSGGTFNLNSGESAQNQWRHAAATVRTDSILLYVDGNLEAAATRPDGDLSTGVRTWVGVDGVVVPVGDNRFTGSLYDLRIWSRPQVQSDIKNNSWEIVNTSRISSLSALYEMSAGSGTSVYDRSGYDNDMAIYGDAVWSSQVPVSYPKNLAAIGGDGKNILHWTASIGNSIRRYDIYRGTSSGSLAVIDSLVGLPPDTNYTDNNVTNGQTYYYKVTARDLAANTSLASNEVSVIPRGVLYVDAASGSDATGIGSSASPYETVQYGLAQAANGDTIYVRPGTYLETLDLGGKWVSLRSTSGKDVTFLTSNGSGTVITAETDEESNTEVVGFTIKDASTGVSIGSDEEVTIRDCYITDTNYPIEVYADNDINLFNITFGLNGLQAVKMNGENIGYSSSSVTRTWNINNLTINPEGHLYVESSSSNATATLKIIGNAELA
ncbi:MAG: hypothetical protein QF828_09495, partial [Pseudomonadales bacterium]|nr:hypothetical protein [Pseudomonadales bacterium]